MSLENMLSEYDDCTLCPRACHAKRLLGNTGVCGESSKLFVARASLHMWEEPCISGENGSGTVFFSGCPLHCVYCQNHEIANGDVGKEITLERLSSIYLELQDKKANNINLVTATHYLPHVVESVKLARENGLTIPIVYNTSGYETPDAIEKLRGTVDIFLTDFRYMDSDTARIYSNAPDYADYAKASLAKMFDIVGTPLIDCETGLMRKGIIVRILVLPDHYKEAYDILLYLFRTYGNDIYVSILHQYTPLMSNIPSGEQFNSLRRPLRDDEYNYVLDGAMELDMENVFIQEEGAASDTFIPDFDYTGI